MLLEPSFLVYPYQVANVLQPPQALRTLQLLEQHHKSLAHILRFQHEHPSGDAMAETPPTAAAKPDPLIISSDTPKVFPSAQDSQQQPPKLSGNTRASARDTSSIVSNLASARGIPSHPRRSSPVSPTLSAHQAGAKMTEPAAKTGNGDSVLRGPQAYAKGRPSRISAPKQPWSPPTVVSPTEITSQQVIPPDSTEPRRQNGKSPTSEEPFQRFYSTFEGLISKLSAPLAFAGLPLGSDAAAQGDASRKSPAETKLDRHQAMSNRTTLPSEPDVNKLYSRAALRAIRDSNGGNGNTAESFYVVPTTGGTVSYAGILNRAEREARRSSIEEAEDDFVDARETPSPELRQNTGGTKGSKLSRGAERLTSLQNPKTLEELQMENQALKHLSDTLSKRLHMWEVNAQSSSMALQQSLKAMHQQSTTPDHLTQHQPGTAPITDLPRGPPADHDQRVKELEDTARRNERELDKVGRENEKLKNILGRYRERWEKLKEGAKTRRAEVKNGGDNSAGASPSPVPQTSDNLQAQEGDTPPLKPEGDSENDIHEPDSKGVAGDLNLLDP